MVIFKYIPMYFYMKKSVCLQYGKLLVFSIVGLFFIQKLIKATFKDTNGLFYSSFQFHVFNTFDV